MQSLRGSVRILRSHGGSKCFNSSEPLSLGLRSFISAKANGCSASKEHMSYLTAIWRTSNGSVTSSSLLHGQCKPRMDSIVPPFTKRCMTTSADSAQTPPQGFATDPPARIKFKRLDKTSKHIMQILDKEAVEEVKAQREIPDIKPGYIIQIKVEVPENKRRVTTFKGIVIARRNAGLNTTFRLRRLVAGVGVESLFPLYSPNIKEVKVLDKQKVRRAKLYHLRERMNPLKRH